MNILKIILISLGTLSLFVGIIGVFVPGLPTTPFLLLTAGLYIKSSDKLYQKLITNQFVGAYILKFRTHKGMTRKTKLMAIATMWGMILLSCIFFIDPLLIKITILITGIIGTLVMGFIIPTAIIKNKSES